MHFSSSTYLRNFNGQSLLWHRRNTACVILRDAEPFLKHIRWTAREEEVIVADIAADFGLPFSEIKADFKELIAPLVDDGLIESDKSDFIEPRVMTNVEKSFPPFHHDDSWTPLGTFFEDNGLPAELHIDLTTACTERCVHCYLPSYPNCHIPVELAKKTLREFREEQGLTVHLTGGECMLHPQFQEICAYAKSLDLNIIILSNLTCCDGETVDFLRELAPHFVNVSLYSMDEKEHDAITRFPGSWCRTMDAIRNLQAAEVPIRLATPLLRENRKAFNRLRDFARTIHVHLVPDCDIFPKSDHDCSNLEHAVTPEELEEALRENKEIFDKGYAKVKYPSPNCKVCDIGKARLYLDSQGNYYPCDGMHGYILGNAAELSFGDVWRGEKLNALRTLKNHDFPNCVACENRAYCKVCPAYNFNSTGTLFTPNPAKCAFSAVKRRVYGEN